VLFATNAPTAPWNVKAASTAWTKTVPRMRRTVSPDGKSGIEVVKRTFVDAGTAVSPVATVPDQAVGARLPDRTGLARLARATS